MVAGLPFAQLVIQQDLMLIVVMTRCNHPAIKTIPVGSIQTVQRRWRPPGPFGKRRLEFGFLSRPVQLPEAETEQHR